MNLHELRSACANRLSIALPPEEMSAAARWLESGYGIRFNAMRADIFALAVAQGTDRKALRRMRQLAAARNDAHLTNPAEFRRLTPAF